MASEEGRETAPYRVEVSDAADAQADETFFWLAGRSPELAGRWYEGLLMAYESLARFPSRCPLAPENDQFETVEVRQLLYGTGRSSFRILFYVREGTENDPGIVRILHVRHGAQRRLGETKRSGDENDAAS